MYTLNDHVKLHTNVLHKTNLVSIPLSCWKRLDKYTRKITQLSNYLESIDSETLTEEQKRALDLAFKQMCICANQLDRSIQCLTDPIAIEQYGKIGVCDRFVGNVSAYWHACKGELLNCFFQELFINEPSW